MATNDLLLNPGTTITWSDSGGDEVISLDGLGAANVACGESTDFGATDRPDQYQLEVIIDGFTAGPVVGEVIDIYAAQSDDITNWDGQPTTAPNATTEGVFSLAQLANVQHIGSLTVYSTTAGDELQGRFRVGLTARYFAPIVVNRTANVLATATHSVTLTPIPYNVQS